MKGLEALEPIKKMFCPHWSLDNYEIIEQELKVLDTLLDLIGDIEITQYNKKPPRYEIKICGKCFYVGKEEYEPLKEILK